VAGRAYISAAITLTNIVSGTFTLSAAFSWALTNWSALLKYLWHAVFLSKVEVSPYDAKLLTIAGLLTSAIFYASSRQSDTAKAKTAPKSRMVRVLIHFAPLIFIWVIMWTGWMETAVHERMRAEATSEKLVERIWGYPHNGLKADPEPGSTMV
jgi:hypothetical protein